jgi:hypothetical protein
VSTAEHAVEGHPESALGIARPAALVAVEGGAVEGGAVEGGAVEGGAEWLEISNVATARDEQMSRSPMKMLRAPERVRSFQCLRGFSIRQYETIDKASASSNQRRFS